MPGALDGVRILDLSWGIAGPLGVLLLAEQGADVIKVEPPGGDPFRAYDGYRVWNRSRRSLEVDLKSERGREVFDRLLGTADVVVESFRPGVMERLGFGPEVLQKRNPRLVYGRMTGWGQSGPLKNAAGHDINYISITGALHAIGPHDRPVPPLNLVGDYGGGALYLVVGILAALLEAQKSGHGQVVDCAMCDGAASLMSLFCELTAIGRWKDGRESNLLDGGAHFYGTYECKDGEFVSLGSIEPQFYAELRRLAGLDDDLYDGQMNAKNWPALKVKMTAVFKTRTRDEWCAIMQGTDVCFAPVLSLSEAPDHPHMAERQVFVKHDGVVQPAPAPRFSRTPSEIRKTVAVDLAEVAKEWATGR
jgi:alpha-methylacyl-CoA racemase